MSNSALNAMKHGCWLQAYKPADETERHLVTDLVNADWLLQRTTRTYLDIETRRSIGPNCSSMRQQAIDLGFTPPPDPDGKYA